MEGLQPCVSYHSPVSLIACNRADRDAGNSSTRDVSTNHALRVEITGQAYRELAAVTQLLKVVRVQRERW